MLSSRGLHDKRNMEPAVSTCGFKDNNSLRPFDTNGTAYLGAWPPSLARRPLARSAYMLHTVTLRPMCMVHAVTSIQKISLAVIFPPMAM